MAIERSIETPHDVHAHLVAKIEGAQCCRHQLAATIVKVKVVNRFDWYLPLGRYVCTL